MATVWNDLSNQDVFKNETAFNADSWKGTISKIKLLAVPFDKEHQHVLKFDTDAERDHFFFEEMNGYMMEEESGWNFKSLEVFSAGLNKHVGTLRVNLPYEAAMNYNYFAIEMAMQPVPGQVENRREVFYYFLTSLNKKAASTTELFLELDTWMTYINSVKIEQMSLSRGHYLHSQVDSETFLADPISSSFGLLEPEVELPELKPMVASTSFVSMSKNAPRICIAMTGDLSDRKSWTTAFPTETIPNPDSHPVPADATAVATSLNTTWNKNGFLEGAAPALNDYPSAGPKVSVAQQQLGTGAVEGLRVYSMDPEDFPAFIGWARNNRVGIVKSIQAVYVLDSTVISEGSEFSAFGHTFKEVIQDASPKLLEELQLTEEHFNYSEVAKKWAKLYTGQFAKIEVSSGDSRAEIAIEEIAKTLSFYARSSSLFPFLKLEALIDGIGGKGLKKYAVKPLKATEMTTFNSRWSEYSFDLDVPVYSIYVATDQEIGQEELEARKQAAKAIEQAKILELERVDNAMFVARNAVNENWLASSNVRESMQYIGQVRIDNEWNIGEFTRANDYVMATEYGLEPAYEIALASAALNQSNVGVSTLNSKAITEASADTSYEIAALSASTTVGTGTRSAELEYANSLSQVELTRDQWENNEKVEGERYIAWKQNFEENNFDDGWSVKDVFYETTRAIWLASQQMQILMTADVAAIGMLGSGLSSIGAATVGPMNSLGTDGIGSASLGAIGGIASGIVEKLLAVEVLDKIWQYQLTQSYLTYGNEDGGGVASARYEGGRGAADYYGTSAKWAELRQAASLDELRFYEMQIVELTEFTMSKDVREYNSLGDYNRGLTVAENVREVALDNISSVNSTTIETAGLAQTLAYSNAYLEYQTANLLAQNSYDVTVSNAEISKDAAFGVATLAYGRPEELSTAAFRNRENKLTAEFILEREIATHNSNSVKDKNIGEYSYNAAKYIGDLSANTAYSVDRSGILADYLVRAQATPAEYGQASGKAWTDVWGRRGLEVQVIRCTDAVADQAASIFARYGYRTPGIFVKDPELKLMSGFTYWEGEDIWLSGERINETNKQIIKDILSRGVTVWTDTETFFNVDLNDNQLL